MSVSAIVHYVFYNKSEMFIYRLLNATLKFGIRINLNWYDIEYYGPKDRGNQHFTTKHFHIDDYKLHYNRYFRSVF